MATYTMDAEVADLRVERPHVVLLGAGASRAAFPNGDANGRLLPTMAELVDTLELRPSLERAGVGGDLRNFEAIYAELDGRPELAKLRIEVEHRALSYFAALEMPETVTLYDQLVCSLRPKDFIATFNWDPFLYDAMARNQPVSLLPTALFLHGNVRVSVCASCAAYGRSGNPCHRCGGPCEPTRILFPVTRKDYNADPFTANQWAHVKAAIGDAYILTIFGYGAPRTDVEAMKLLSGAWGPAAQRVYEQTQFIDIRPEADLLSTWEPFIHSHHYDVHRDIRKSVLFRHPRRSCEATWAMLMDAQWIMHASEMPESGPLDTLHRWLEPRLAVERTQAPPRRRVGRPHPPSS
ncbi:MAG: hypothetical protein U1E39_09460 [Planctomycetota bacterium]